MPDTSYIISIIEKSKPFTLAISRLSGDMFLFATGDIRLPRASLTLIRYYIYAAFPPYAFGLIPAEVELIDVKSIQSSDGLHDTMCISNYLLSW